MFNALSKLHATVAYDRYWHLAAERQALFFRRLTGSPPPWTQDPVLANYKFTNAYRASDRVSQYLIRNVIYRDGLPNDSQEVFFRVLLFKLFNSIPTWQLLERTIGLVTWAEYTFDAYDRVLSEAMANGKAIYSSAYIMPSGRGAWGHGRKHANHLMMLEQMMYDELPSRLKATRCMEEGFSLLRQYSSIGDFLAYQFITDLNYSPLVNYTEMEFIVPGPGAKSGIKKCFPDLEGVNPADVVRLVSEEQESEFDRRGITFQSLWGRPLQLIDCQNLFCEVDKYTRVSNPELQGTMGRRRIKHRFVARAEPVTAWYPPKWGLNGNISSECGHPLQHTLWELDDHGVR